MAYVAPTTRASGFKVPATVWNSDVVNNIKFLARPPSAKAHRDATQTLGDSAWTAVQFDTEKWDTDTIFSSTQNERFNINTPGKYLCTFTAEFKGSSAGTFRGVAIQVDSTGILDTNEGARALNNADDFINVQYGLSVSDVFSLTSTQFVCFLMIQNSGGNLDTSTELLNQPRASVTWVSS